MDKPKPTAFNRTPQPGYISKKPNKRSRPREKRPARPAQLIHWKATIITANTKIEDIVTATSEIEAVKIVYARYSVTPDSIEKAKLVTFVVTTEDEVDHEQRAATHEHAKKLFLDEHPFYVGQAVMVSKRPYVAPEHLMDRPFRNLTALLKGAK